MKIRSVAFNNRRKGFEILAATKRYWYPYAKLKVKPISRDLVVRVFVDDELGSEGFTYILKSGREGTVHIEQVLEYNQDPSYIRDALVYKLTLEAQRRVEESSLSKREIIRRLGTSAAQFYRLIDQTNYRKSIDQLLSLLNVLECDVDFSVRVKSASRTFMDG